MVGRFPDRPVGASVEQKWVVAGGLVNDVSGGCNGVGRPLVEPSPAGLPVPLVIELLRRKLHHSLQRFGAVDDVLPFVGNSAHGHERSDLFNRDQDLLE